MPGRSFVGANGYRYGFNGKESDSEIKGSSGTSYDFGARIYDSRLGRFLSVDPLAIKYVGESPYNFAGNSPITLVDENGESKISYIKFIDKNGKTSYVTKTDDKTVAKINLGGIHHKTNCEHGGHAVEYDIFVFQTIDYSQMEGGKPKITTEVKLDKRTLADAAGEALWGVEEWMGTEAEGNGWIDDQEASEHGKLGERDPTDGMVEPDLSIPVREKDKDGFTKDGSGNSGKNFKEGILFKNDKGDTIIKWDPKEHSQKWEDVPQTEKAEVKKWTPE